MRKFINVVASLALALALATSLQAQPLPDETTLGDQLARSLPDYWKVNEFAILATTEAGDALRPRAYIRFEADAAPMPKARSK